MDASAESLVSAYINMRDERDRIINQQKQALKSLEEQMDLVSKALLGICKDNKLDGFRTDFGTVSQIVKTEYWTNDWESLYKFVKENDAFHLLHKRINQSGMKEFLDENPDVHPAGLNVDQEYSIRVTRPRGS
jgi:enamine deaminase RidA (YjgF/YER057c/UK114 family)